MGVWGNGPLFSVLVVAYGRRKYLGQAVESALNQTLPRHLYEVVVTKNFVTEQDEKWRARGVRLVDFGGGGAGLQVAEALEHCRGSVVVHLDDDDWWEPNKLERAASVWCARPDTAYYHNGMVFEFEEALSEDWKKTMLRFSRRWRRTHPWYNNSCAAVSKRVLLDKIEYLRRVWFALDLFYYFAALSVGGRPVFDEALLTHYRVPPSERQRSHREDRLVVRKMVEDTGNERLLRHYDQMVMCGRKYLDLVEKCGSGKRVAPKELFEYARCVGRPQNLVRLLVVGVGLFSPQLAQRAHRLVSGTLRE